MNKLSNVKEMISLIQRSNVVDPKRLAIYFRNLDDLKNNNLTSDELLEKMVNDRMITTFHSNLLRKGKWKGFCLGNYRILDKIARGGMGIVYIAEHAKLNNKVAVKVLSSELAENNITKQRFIREAQAAAILNHENIVRVIDVTTDSNPPYIVMEYVDGLSLQACVATSGPMNYSAAAVCGHQIALGLQHIYKNNLVHRDIKPANLVLDRKGVVKILDLGIARLNDGQQLTKIASSEKLILGTIEYLAPEQALDSTNVDIRADIYSLGASLYFLLCGEPPFEKANSTTKLVMKQMGQPPAVHTLNAKVPVKFSLVIQHMLHPSPHQRYQTPQEVANALRPFAICPAGFPDYLMKKSPTFLTDVVDQTPMPNQENSILNRYKFVEETNDTLSVNEKILPNSESEKFEDSSGELECLQTAADITPLVTVNVKTEIPALSEVTKFADVPLQKKKKRISRIFPFLIGLGIGLIVLLSFLLWFLLAYEKPGKKRHAALIKELNQQRFS